MTRAACGNVDCERWAVPVTGGTRPGSTCRDCGGALIQPAKLPDCHDTNRRIKGGMND